VKSEIECECGKKKCEKERGERKKRSVKWRERGWGGEWEKVRERERKSV
jgi:hypothetical protein